jgi:hypothetical protein
MEKIIVFVSPKDRLDWWLIDWPIESKVKIEFVDEKNYYKYAPGQKKSAKESNAVIITNNPSLKMFIIRNFQCKLVTDYRLFYVMKMNEFLKFQNHKA